MTGPVRRMHLHVWVVVALMAVAILATAIACRDRPLPVNPLLWEDLK